MKIVEQDGRDGALWRPDFGKLEENWLRTSKNGAVSKQLVGENLLRNPQDPTCIGYGRKRNDISGIAPGVQDRNPFKTYRGKGGNPAVLFKGTFIQFPGYMALTQNARVNRRFRSGQQSPPFDLAITKY